MKLKRFAANAKRSVTIAGLAMSTVPMLASMATAQSADFSPFKDAQGAVYVSGNPNSEKIVTIGGLPTSRNLTTNACGVTILKNSATRPIPSSFTIGSNTITPANLSTQLLPKCLTTGQLEEARTSNFKTPTGDVVIVGQTPNTVVAMSFLDTKQRRVRLNACGIGRISSSFTSNVTFTVDSITKTFAEFATQSPWVCRNGVTYRPHVGS